MANRENYFEHIFYEFHMFAYTYNLLIDIACGKRKSSDEEKNIAVESFYIHLRNIVQFFRASSTDKDDILAKNTIDCKFRNQFSKCIIADQGRDDFINKCVCHISKKRRNWKQRFDTKCLDAFSMSKDVIDSVRIYLKLLEEKHASSAYASDLEAEGMQDFLKQLQYEYTYLNTPMYLARSVSSTATTGSLEKVCLVRNNDNDHHFEVKTICSDS